MKEESNDPFRGTNVGMPLRCEVIAAASNLLPRLRVPVVRRSAGQTTDTQPLPIEIIFS
jgi:hypothetical protein